MKKSKLINWKTALILILFLAAFLRIYQLGNVPYGVPDDEAAYVYNSYSIWHTSKDILGKFLPLSFNAHSSMSPVVVYVTAPFVGILGLSPFSGRLPSALLGIGSVLLVFLITDYLFKNKPVSLLSALLFSVSPWALQIARGAVPDTNFAFFFLLFGIFIFIRNIKNRNFLWSLIPFALGFYSYHATKVYFVFLIPVLIFIYRRELLEKKKELLFFVITCILIGISFLFIIKTQSVTRQADVYLLGNSTAAKNVTTESEKNTSPQILSFIFSGKPLYYLRIMRENYLEAFSTDYLFLYGDTHNSAQIVNIFFRGELYIIEFPFLILGLYFIFSKKNRFSKSLIILLLIIAPLPSTFTIDKNFVDRDIMMLPILLIMISYGIYNTILYFSKFKNIYKYIFISCLCIFYMFLVSEYLYQYYYRWPIYGAEGWDTSSRDLANYITKNKSKFDNVFISNSGKDYLLKYAIYNSIGPDLVQKVWNDKPVKIDNIVMLQGCLNNGAGEIKNFLPQRSLYISSFNDCHYTSTPSAKIVDKGEPLRTIWNIYEN